MASRFGRSLAILRSLALLSSLLLAVSAVRAEDPDEAEIKLEADGTAPRKLHAIPYPNGALYLNRGISGAFMGGKHRNLGEKSSLYQWQGELGYFYKPWLSGGLGFKITAGEPSSAEQKIFNRYFIQVRFHKTWEKMSLYVGPQLGMGNLNLLSDSSADSTKSPLENTGPIKIGNTKPTLGLELGGGWMFNKYVGFTLGNHLEYSLVDEEGVGVTNALNLHINPGLAIDILAFTETLRDLIPAMFVNIEFQSGFLIFEKSGHRQDQAGVLGIGLAF
ncbi:MAG: hypothetical protein JWO30_2375 [Fibrobacteres bacterium]|nr:hypothetical protein [Fibrobacterota bacterium]